MSNEAGSKNAPPTRADGATEGPGFTVQDAQSRAEGAESLPSVDFSTFVISLAASALHHLGLAEDPQGGTPPDTNLPLARQTIDTLEMLEVKTAGNLEAEEAKLLQSVLYELHMAFVKASG